MTAIATIVALIAVFVGLFPAEGGVIAADLTVTLPLVGAVALTDLGLNGLTGFANLNLLAPLAVVNAALIVNRRKFPDIDRPFSVPASPWVPVIGILANVALIYNLPFVGIVVGVVIEAVLVGGYLAWGGAPDRGELVTETVEARQIATTDDTGVETERSGTTGAPVGDGATEVGTDDPGDEGLDEADDDRFRILVPVERPDRAGRYARFAAAVGRLYGDDPVVRLLNVTEIPEQTESAALVDTAQERADRISAELSEARADLDATVFVEGHICRDVAFDILTTARDESVDRIVMGYPEERRDITESVEYKAPCYVLFLNAIDDGVDLSTVTIGAGGGPHHDDLLDLANVLTARGTTVHVVNVTPTGGEGTSEDTERTLARFDDREAVEVHRLESDDISESLADVATEVGGSLLVGASRNRVFKRYVFGGVADSVIDRSTDRRIPTVIYASQTGLGGRVQSAVFAAYRYLLKSRS